MKAIIAKKEHVNKIAKVLKDAYFKSLSEARARAKEKIENKECIIVAGKKDVQGVLMYARDFSHYANYIEDLAVSKKHRRKGIASTLLARFLEISKKEQPKKQKYVLSSTDVTNKASIKLHSKLGFEKIGKIKALHYGKDEIFFGYKIH
jgi:ribosomal protein S18 acetylase RimI-like enzyme